MRFEYLVLLLILASYALLEKKDSCYEEYLSGKYLCHNYTRSYFTNFTTASAQQGKRCNSTCCLVAYSKAVWLMSFVAVTGSLHSCETPHTVRQRYTEFEYYLQMSPYTSVRKTFLSRPRSPFQ